MANLGVRAHDSSMGAKNLRPSEMSAARRQNVNRLSNHDQNDTDYMTYLVDTPLAQAHPRFRGVL